MFSRRSPRAAAILAAAALAVIAVAYTWPLPALAGAAVAHDRGDPLLVTWILWWTSHTTPLTSAWWNAPAFYPSTGVLAFSENLLSLAPLTAPIIWLTGSPLLAYNVAFVLSYVLSGIAAYTLAFVLTRCAGASFVAAVAFAFAPYRLSHTQHLQLLSSYWMPVAIAALHLYVRTPAWRWAALFSAAWVLQALASGYYLFFLTALAALWMLWFIPGRLSLRDVARLAAAWMAGAVLLAPVMLGYRSVHASYGFRRSPVEVVNYSADVLGMVSAAPDSLLWSALHAPVSSESEQFPGITIPLILAAGVLFHRKGWLGREVPATEGAFGFYVSAAVAMWLFSLGPAPRIAGAAMHVPGPYAILAHLPGFDGIRVPARFWMLAVICLATAAALVVSRVANPRLRRTVVLAATIGILLDGWPHAFPVVSAPGMRVTSTTARLRLGLPLHEAETETMYGAIAQGRSVFNGYSGYAAPQHAALRELLEHHDPRILARLAAREPIEIIVETAGDADGQWNAFVRRQPGARRVDAREDWTAYELAATGANAPAPPSGSPIQIARIETTRNQPDINAVLDGDLDTRWHTQPQEGGETITVDVGRPQHVAAIVLCLGAYAGQYPRGLRAEVSRDGSAWTPVSEGGTTLETYDAALRSPREVPITIPVLHDDVRYVRLTQTGGDARRGWTIVELRVIG